MQAFMDEAARVEHPAAAEQPDMPADLTAAIAQVGAASRNGMPMWDRRAQALRVCRKISASLGEERRALDEIVQPHIRGMVQQVNLPLLHVLCAGAGVPDDTLAQSFASGFEAVGDVPPSGWWEIHVQPAQHDMSDLDHEAWTDRLEAKIRREADMVHGAADRMAVLDRTMEECAAGLMAGPFTREQLDTAYGKGAWRAMHRFGVLQNGKIRACDNARTSLHNAATSTFERLACDVPDFAARVCAAFAELARAAGSRMPEMSGGTEDLADAYRHVPTCSPQFTCVVLEGPNGEPTYFTLPGFNFGLRAAVPQFNRFTEAATAIARRLFSIVCTHYFDDFAVVEPSALRGNGQHILGGLMCLLGMQFKPSKHVPHAAAFTFLGVQSDLSLAHRGQVTMSVTRERVEKLVSRCADVLETGSLPLSVAQSLCGKLQFTLSWAFGRIGRACMQPLHTHDSEYLSPAAAASLRYIISILPHIPPHTIRLLSTTARPALIFTDGCAEEAGATQAVGFIVGIPPDGEEGEENAGGGGATGGGWGLHRYTWYHGGGDIPQDIRRALVERRQQIGQVEIIGALLPYTSLPHLLAGRDAIHWIDNTSALAALCKGYSRAPDSARLVHAFHAWNVKAQARVWFEYVPSAANPSDEPSRVPLLWDADFRPATGVVSHHVAVRFPPLSGYQDPGSWMAEATAMLATL